MRQKGILTLTNPTSDVSFSITALRVYNIFASVQHCSKVTPFPTTILQGSTATMVFTAESGYKMPSTAPTISTATVVSWTVSTTSTTDDTGTLILSNPTGDVSFTVTGERARWGGTDLTGTKWRLNVYSCSSAELQINEWSTENLNYKIKMALKEDSSILYYETGMSCLGLGYTTTSDGTYNYSYSAADSIVFGKNSAWATSGRGMYNNNGNYSAFYHRYTESIYKTNVEYFDIELEFVSGSYLVYSNSYGKKLIDFLSANATIISW